MAKSNGSTPGVPAMVKGGLRGLLGKDKDYDGEAYKAVESIREECPLVAEILGGVKASQTEPAVAPGSITIYFREGRLCWSANVKSAKATFFGTVADITNPWGSINSALLLGECSQKEYSERLSNGMSLADVPH